MPKHTSALYRAAQADERDTTRFELPDASATLGDMAPKGKDRLRAALAAFFDRQDEQGVSRTALCRKAKVSESTVRGFLDGRTRTMQHDTLEKLAAAAGVTVNAMLGDAAAEASSAPGDFAREHMRVLLAEVLTFMEREKIHLSPRRFADLAMAIYGLSIKGNPSAFEMTGELESLIRLYAES